MIISSENFEKCLPDSLKDWDYSFQSAWPCRCSFGLHQSPAVLSQASAKLSQSSLSLRYKPATAARAEPRNLLEIELFGDFGELSYRNSQFLAETLRASRVSFKFPAEHTLQGQRFPLEIAISHVSRGNPLILSLLVDAETAGNLNTFFENLDSSLWSFEHAVSLQNSPNLADLFAEMQGNLEFFEYMGSETAPPCAEAVKRLVIAQPLRIPATQLRKLREKAAKISNSRVKPRKLARFAENFARNTQDFKVYFSRGSEGLRENAEIQREIRRKVREKLRKNKKRLFPEKYVSVSTNSSQFFVSFAKLLSKL